MAYSHMEWCSTCKSQQSHISGHCTGPACAMKARKEREEKEAAWKATPIEDKVEILRQRVEALENRKNIRDMVF